MGELAAFLARGVGILGEDREITVRWDAGGDETLVNVAISGDQNTESDFCGALRAKIKDALHLPNAGEHYHDGHGRVVLDEAGRLVLRFHSEDSYLNEEFFSFDDERVLLRSDPQWHQPSPIERAHISCSDWRDPGGVETLLQRAELRLGGILDCELNSRELVHLDIIHGDSVVLDDGAVGYYRERIREVLDRSLEFFGDGLVDRKEFAAIYVEAATRSASGAEFFVEPNAFGIYRLHRGDELVLWEADRP